MSLIPRTFYLDDFFDDFVPQKQNSMKCDIFEENGIYNVEIDIPGFSKEDITVETNNGYVTITAEKATEEENESRKYIRKERTYGRYQRSFNFGEIDEEQISAEFQNGILKLSIPKKTKVETKKVIDIK